MSSLIMSVLSSSSCGVFSWFLGSIPASDTGKATSPASFSLVFSGTLDPSTNFLSSLFLRSHSSSLSSSPLFDFPSLPSFSPSPATLSPSFLSSSSALLSSSFLCSLLSCLLLSLSSSFSLSSISSWVIKNVFKLSVEQHASCPPQS